MEHEYHAQREATRYYHHIPIVPDAFPVEPALLVGQDEGAEDDFRTAFKGLAALMERAYRDAEAHPEAYGLPLVPIGTPADKQGNPARDAYRALKRLGDTVRALGEYGSLRGDTLRVPIDALKPAFRKIKGVAKIMERLGALGLAFEGYAGGALVKGADTLIVRYPERPSVLWALHAYVAAPPFESIPDHHAFYYFDYKRVADRDKLPRDAYTADLAALLDSGEGEALLAAHGALTGMGLTAEPGEDGLEYFHKKKRVARLIVDFAKRSLWLNVKVKGMDGYMEAVAALPPRVRAIFEHDSCRYCGFQGATDEHCKFRISWTLDGVRRDACGFFFAGITSPAREEAEALCGLLRPEYGLA